MSFETQPRHCSQCGESLGFNEVRCPNCGNYEELRSSDPRLMVVAVLVASVLAYAWAKVTGRDGLANLLEWFI
jgi:predicted RNA-binding Zn-ribbon protein involved in translation (DUF1610 family)